MGPYRLSEIARTIGGTLAGSDVAEIRGVAGIREATPGEISFLAHPRYAAYLATTRASALIVGEETDLPADANGHLSLVRVKDPYLGFLRTLELFGGDRPRPEPGIHPTAVIEANVTLGADVSIGAHCVVESGAVIGDRVVLLAGVYVGAAVEIGRDTVLYPNVVLRERCRIGERVIVHAGAVIGADGFGFVRDGESQLKVPQLGTVIVEDDVEIGANTTIDRATIGATLVRRGAKIDNLVQIAHNVTIGANSIVCAQVGISGSTEVGASVTLAGQAGVIGHIKIGDRAMVGAQAGVTKSVLPDARVSGYPANDHDQALRIQAHTRRLPDLVRELRRLEARITLLERELEKERERVV